MFVLIICSVVLEYSHERIGCRSFFLFFCWNGIGKIRKGPSGNWQLASLWSAFNKACIHTHTPYTSGHDYLDAERASCPMNTHWNTVWSNGESYGAFPLFLYSVAWLRVERVLQFSMLWQFQFHLEFHVSRSGVWISVKAIFCDVTPMTTHINQSIKLFKKYSPLIDRCRKLGKGKKAKKLPWLGFEPQTWKCGICSGTGTATARCRGKEGKRPMIAYCFTQCSNGYSLGSLLFPRQDNPVQRCIHLAGTGKRQRVEPPWIGRCQIDSKWQATGWEVPLDY